LPRTESRWCIMLSSEMKFCNIISLYPLFFLPWWDLASRLVCESHDQVAYIITKASKNKTNYGFSGRNPVYCNWWWKGSMHN
jgi:hypothetical protein